MVFQNYALWPHMTIFDNIAYGLKLEEIFSGRDAGKGEPHAGAGQPDGPRKALSGRALGRPAAARGPGARPGSQPGRAPPGRAALQPGRQDPPARCAPRSASSRRSLAITTIYVTHDQEEALTLSDRIAVLDHGKLQQLGSPRELYEKPGQPLRGRFHRHQQPDRRAR